MYSLYRAWFGEENYSHLETLSPPDTVVRVGNDGEHQFVAHRGVLAAHSGYLKALLSTTATSGSSRVTGDSPNPITSISVSSIGGEAFAPLLNYMYTGRLEVTLENIYSVLLATHLLHMPGALEQCRAALLRLRGPAPPPPLPQATTPSSTILRPVANRLVGSSVCWPQSSLYSSGTVGFPLLPALQLPPRIPVLQNSPGTIHETSTAYRVNSPEPSSSTYTPDRAQKYSERSDSPVNIVSTSKLKDSKGCLRVNSKQDEKTTKKDQEYSQSHRTLNSSPGSEKISIINIDTLTQNKSSGRSSISSNELPTTSSAGVVLDIACCDGPVKFHRVLNENYTKPDNGLSNNQVENNNSGSNQRRVSQTNSASSSAESEIICENDENGRPNRRSEFDESSVGSSETAGGNYTCEYCRHTFKSHYCYKKHARRHLLPTGTEEAANQRPENKRRREVRLLDLNVQYYPCKICGSKFPSYYFVHKHKKLCHSTTEILNSENEDNAANEAAGCSTQT